MKRKLKYIVVILGMLMALGGCSNGKEDAEVVSFYQPTEEDLSYALPKIGEAKIITMKQEEGAKGTITVATVGSPNTEILQEAGKLLETQGYLLKIEVCEDYLSPNQMVAEGKADCNYFQHAAYLERYNIEKESNLTEVAKIHYEPLAIFSEKVNNISEVSKGAKVLIPQNPTAMAQALFLLQDQGLLTLMEDADLLAVLDDILENPFELELILTPEEEMVSKLGENELIICHKSYMMKEGKEAEEILLAEESKASMAAQNLAQGIVVSDISNQNAAILTEVLMSKEIQQFLNTRYQNTFYMMEGRNNDISLEVIEEETKEETKESN